jgi:uncharacterized protein
MDVTPVISERRQLIRSYGGGKFVINDIPFETSLILFPEKVVEWPVKTMAELTEQSLVSIADAADEVEILLIGTGHAQQFVSPALRRAFKEKHGIVIDAMDTGAACRTFNVLMAEDRRVAAALMVC